MALHILNPNNIQESVSLLALYINNPLISDQSDIKIHYKLHLVYVGL